MTGAEIEGFVHEALYLAYDEDQDEPVETLARFTKDLLLRNIAQHRDRSLYNGTEAAGLRVMEEAAFQRRWLDSDTGETVVAPESPPDSPLL
jgi:hypothetical protein